MNNCGNIIKLRLILPVSAMFFLCLSVCLCVSLSLSVCLSLTSSPSPSSSLHVKLNVPGCLIKNDVMQLLFFMGFIYNPKWWATQRKQWPHFYYSKISRYSTFLWQFIWLQSICQASEGKKIIQSFQQKELLKVDEANSFQGGKK